MSFTVSEALSSLGYYRGFSDISRRIDDLLGDPEWVIMVVESVFQEVEFFPDNQLRKHMGITLKRTITVPELRPWSCRHLQLWPGSRLCTTLFTGRVWF